MADELTKPIFIEPIKNQEIEIKPINQPNFSVNYPGGQGYLGQDPNLARQSGSGPYMPPGGHMGQGNPQMRMGPGGGQMMGPGGPQMMGPGGPQMMGPGGPLKMGPGGPQMMGPGGPQMMGPGGPQMMGPGGPQMMGPGGPQMMGPGGPQMMRPNGGGGAPMGGPNVMGGGQRQMNNPNIPTNQDEYSNMNYEKSYACYEDCMQSCCSCCGSCKQFIPCLCVDSPNIEVPQSFCGLKLRFGRYVETLSAGLQFITPTTEKMIIVDLQTQTLDLVKQNVITKDNITVTIDTAINFKVINPRYAMFRLDNLQESVKNITYSALRTVCGMYTLPDIQEKKQEITAQLQNYIAQRVSSWGIIIEQIFIKDIILSADLQQTLSSAAKMMRAAESKVISAKADVESAKLMKEAADSLSSTAAMQIRYYETISHLATNQSQKIVFIPFVQDQEF